MTAIAAKTMAWAPFGHAVTTQNSSTAPIVTNARNPFTRAGSKSGTPNQAERGPGMFLVRLISSRNAGLAPVGRIDRPVCSLLLHRHGSQFCWNTFEHNVCFRPAIVASQKLQ